MNRRHRSESCPKRYGHSSIASKGRLAGLLAVVAGLLALAWLVVRSGAKPSRLAYPCQRAALATTTGTLGAFVLGVLVLLRRRFGASPWSIPGVALAVATIAVVGFWSSRVEPPVAGPLGSFAASAAYRAQVFDESGCPQNPVGDRFLCVENLLETMGAAGLKFYRSPALSLTAGPDGIVAPNDVVIVKINYQWGDRGGTNVDLLRGLIRRIVSHPDGFAGEVVVCENAQFNSTSGFDRTANNAQDIALSPHDAVTGFAGQGFRVSAFDWTLVRLTSVAEFDAGDPNHGYVVSAYDPRFGGSLSYPKFTTSYGTRISLKKGIWTAEGGYDRTRLKVINLPVLKSHHAVYGATASVKNFMGVVTTALSTNSHAALASGNLGAVMADVGPPDLNLIDAIWVNANPFSGPGTPYATATRADRLVASRDPVAADLWAVTNVLIPGFVANGYVPPWPYPSADPALPASAFRNYLDRSMGFLLSAGIDVTNDPARIDVVALGPPGEASDPTGGGEPLTVSKFVEGYRLSWSSPVRGDAAASYELYEVPLAGLAHGTAPKCAGDLGVADRAIVPELSENHAFVVVARNSAGAGSLGRDNFGRDRRGPDSSGACP